MVGDTIIIAPHADDEIIGTFEVLISEVNPIIIYTEPIDEIRKQELTSLKDIFKIKEQLFLRQIPGLLLKKENIFFFPDPTYELHPAHRLTGSIGESFARNGYNVIFYNTNMNAPYIHEVSDSTQKENALNFCYPSQQSLWQFEKKFILFEGYSKWYFNVGDLYGTSSQCRGSQKEDYK